MNSQEALRFLAHEASWCRDHDAHEALCLLLPSLLEVLDLEPMNGYEAEEFKARLKHILQKDFRFDPEPSTVGCGGAT